MAQKWFQKTYRRLLLDMHVSDLDPRFLTGFDPKVLVENVTRANINTLTISANTHTGLCYWPTKVGVMHPGIHGRDLLREMLDEGHRHGLNMIVYFVSIYIEDYPLQHPEARVVAADGTSERLLMNSAGKPRRFWMACPNNQAYRQFVVAQLEEICQNYDFEGVWPDMAMWPTVCYCEACQQRYADEVGGEMPRVADWTDPVWVNFQRRREEWLCEFAQLETDTIRKYKPEATVAHQAQTFAGDWLFGASIGLSNTTDWLSSDYYGDRYQLSFYAKLFYSLSNHKPFEHLNSWCYPNIHEHVVQRTESYMKAIAFSAIMNHGSPAFIDAIDPVGTINPDRYRRAAPVMHEVEKYEPHIGGRFCQDVGIYFSYDSLYDLADNGKPVMKAMYNFEPGKDFGGPTSHRNAAINTSRMLTQYNIPYGVITRKHLADLKRYQIVILPNVVTLTDEEMAAFRDFVSAGGSLYASKYTSLVSQSGERQQDFLLADLFGVSFEGETDEVLTYVSPAPESAILFEGFSAQYPVTLRSTQTKVRAKGDVTVLATVTLPYTDPRGTPYTAILTDPPGRPTNFPSVVLNSYGKGKVMYSAGPLEIWDYDPQLDVFRNLIGLLQTRPFAFESDAPKPVEITLFDQPDRSRFVVNLINFPPDLPPIPVTDIQVRVRIGDERHPVRVVRLPEGQDLLSTVRDGWVEFTASRLESYLMLAVEYAS